MPDESVVHFGQLIFPVHLVSLKVVTSLTKLGGNNDGRLSGLVLFFLSKTVTTFCGALFKHCECFLSCFPTAFESLSGSRI